MWQWGPGGSHVARSPLLEPLGAGRGWAHWPGWLCHSLESCSWPQGWGGRLCPHSQCVAGHLSRGAEAGAERLTVACLGLTLSRSWFQPPSGLLGRLGTCGGGLGFRDGVHTHLCGGRGPLFACSRQWTQGPRVPCPGSGACS